jgi:hypothetical protein
MPRGRRNRQRVLALNGVATVGLARLTHCIARTWIALARPSVPDLRCYGRKAILDLEIAAFRPPKLLKSLPERREPPSCFRIVFGDFVPDDDDDDDEVTRTDSW